jgi:hypothetical protein
VKETDVDYGIDFFGVVVVVLRKLFTMHFFIPNDSNVEMEIQVFFH